MGAFRLLTALLLAASAGAARVRVGPGSLGGAATGFAADAATRRALLQTQGGSSSETASDMLTQMLLTIRGGNHAEAARASSQLLSMLVLAKLQSAFVITESILITDATVSLVTVTDKANSTVTVVPGETFWDAAFGEVFQAGVSGLFYVDTQQDLMGALPAVGNQITVANIEGKVNVPAHRRRRLANVEALAASQPAGHAPPPPAEQTVHLPRRMTASVSPAQLAALTAGGFWERLFTVLPPSLHANLTTLLQQTSIPLGEYMLRQNVTQAEVDRALAGLHGDNLTITQPVIGPHIGAFTVIPVLDVVRVGVTPWVRAVHVLTPFSRLTRSSASPCWTRPTRPAPTSASRRGPLVSRAMGLSFRASKLCRSCPPTARSWTRASPQSAWWLKPRTPTTQRWPPSWPRPRSSGSCSSRCPSRPC